MAERSVAIGRLGRLSRVLVLGLLSLSSGLQARGWDGSFEQLHFDIRWLFVPAGVAIVQARQPAPGVARFRMEACSNSAVDLFYKVRDLIRVTSDRSNGELRPRVYRYKQREGRHHSDLTLDFQPEAAVEVTDHETGETRTYSVPPATLDVVSAFHATRSLPLEVGSEYRMPVFDKDKFYQLSVAVLRREKLDTVLGESTPTVVIHPRLKSEGIFKRSGELYLWLTDDARHLPVRMESRVKLGKIVSELTHVFTRPPETPQPQMICEAYRNQEQ